MSDIYRRCGCRRPDGNKYAPLPDRATDGQRAGVCPELLRDPRHGSWGFTVSAGSNPRSGKRVLVRRMGFPTKREAQRERARVVEQIGSGRFRSDDGLTTGTWVTEWLGRRVSDGLRPSTARMYRSYVEREIVPALGRVRLSDLRRRHVDRFVREMLAAGRGTTTVRRVHAVLSSALSAAERIDLVPYNAASKVALPRLSPRRLRVWEPEQVRAFLDVADGHRLGPLYELAVFTGLRRGELAGLRWTDVDLLRRQLRVREQRVQFGSSVIEGPVKTDAGQDRVVALGGEAFTALIAWRTRQDDERRIWENQYHDDGYLFTMEDGRPLKPNYISRTFEILVVRAGVPRMSVHGLRHQHASLMLAGGVDLAIVSKRLGHSTLTITSDLYSHLLGAANLNAAEAGEAVLPPRSAHRSTPSARPIRSRP